MIGLIAVGFVVLEWIRTAMKDRNGRVGGDVLAADQVRAEEGDTA